MNAHHPAALKGCQIEAVATYHKGLQKFELALAKAVVPGGGAAVGARSIPPIFQIEQRHVHLDLDVNLRKPKGEGYISTGVAGSWLTGRTYIARGPVEAGIDLGIGALEVRAARPLPGFARPGQRLRDVERERRAGPLGRRSRRQPEQ